MSQSSGASGVCGQSTLHLPRPLGAGGSIFLDVQELFSESNLLEASRNFIRARTDQLEKAVGKDNPKIRIPTGIDRVDLTILLDANSARRERFLKKISHSIRSGRYIFSPFRERLVPKPGGWRTISVCTVRDALVQFVLLPALETELDHEFSRSCFGYRSGKSANKAVSVIKRYVGQGWSHVLDGDIQTFFDKVPHGLLLAQFRTLMPDAQPELKKLLRTYLKAKKVAPDKFEPGKWMRLKPNESFESAAQMRTIGLPQGGALSGFLTNVYLTTFDRIFDSHPQRFKLVRYADDFVVLCKTPEDVTEAKAIATETLAQLGLALHPSKTLETTAASGFNFLGYKIRATPVDGKIALQIRVKSATLSKRYKKLRSLFLMAREGRWCTCKLRYRLNLKLVGVDPEHKFWKEKIGRNSEILPQLLMTRSWLRYFVSVNRVGQLRKMDRWVKQRLFSHHQFYKAVTDTDSQLNRCWCRKHAARKLFEPLLTYVREFYRVRTTLKAVKATAQGK